MTAGTYIVQEADTLSHIAQRFGVSVDDMQRLNPFIGNPNYIRTGWELQVPEHSEKPASSEPSAAPEIPVQAILHLNPIAVPPEQCTVDFCGEQRCKSSTHYADVIYEVGQNRFWLLREHTLAKLMEAADDLQKKLLTTDPDARINALNDAGLLEPFLEPKASSFLDGPDSQRYLQAEYDLARTNGDLEQIGVGKKGLTDPAKIPNFSIDQLKHVNQQQQSVLTLRRELNLLAAKGNGIALQRGYKFENGHLYSSEALKAREIIQRYLTQRQKLLDLGNKHFSQEEIEKFTSEHAALLAEMKTENLNHSLPSDAVQWVHTSRRQFHYSELIKTLLEAAAYGLALPEYALTGENEDIQTGFQDYDEYHSLLRQKAALEQRVQTSFEHWINVAKQQPPSSLFKAEEVDWRKLETQERKLKKKAEDFVKNTKPVRHLLWNPETFAPQPQQRLVRTNFPLREISVPTEATRLRHLSLNAVLKDLNQRAQTVLKEDLKKALANAKDPLTRIKAGDTSADPDLFSTWLRMHDARPLEIQDSWFNSNGFFQPGTFKRYIKTEKIYIENLRDDATFDAWGKDLQQMLFKQSTLGPLRLFDNSPQARLIRCLAPPPNKMQLGAGTLAPGVSLKKGISTSAQVTMDINLAQGEIDIAKFELPSKADAGALMLRYQSDNQWSEPVNFGKFCLAGWIKAWGFAGASMMLSANLRVGPNKQENDDIGLDNGRDAERRLSRAETGLKPHIRHDDLLGADFNLFAGVQSGIKISGSLLWKPPSDLLTVRHPMFKKNVDTDGWLELATLGIDASAALGVGAKAGLTLSLQNGYVILRMKASVVAGPGVAGAFNFVVGYKAIVQILDIFNKALVENNYKKMTWVDGEAFAYLSKLQLLNALGMDVEWLFLRGYNLASRIYDVMKAGGRAGPIALVILRRENDPDFNHWYSSLTPEGLGSLLDTLSSTAQSFTIIAGERTEKYSSQSAHLVQQQAIEIILKAIYQNATSIRSEDKLAYEDLTSAQERFGNAILRFESFNKPADSKMTYCINIQRLDAFMVATAGKLPEQSKMRRTYFFIRNELGGPMDKMLGVSETVKQWDMDLAIKQDLWKNQ